MKTSQWRARIRGTIRWLSLLWGSSLRLRVVAGTVAAGVIILLSLGAMLSVQVRDGLFDERVEQILADAALRAESAQRRFDAATANSSSEVQLLANDTVQELQETAAGTAAVVLLRSEHSTGPIQIVPATTDTTMREAITPELRQRVVDQQFQQWQSIEIMDSRANIPGVAVGSAVVLPGAGEHELYFIYSLDAEQSTLSMLQRALAIGAVGLLGALVLLTWYLVRQVLDPVKRASNAATQLADGELSVRMSARGQDELALLGRAFNEMAENLQDQIEQLAELSHMQQRFVSDVSHELRTPLTTIKMAAELLYDSRDDLRASNQRSVELLHDQLNRFETLLADLLEISRFDAKGVELSTHRENLADVVHQVADLTRPIALKRGSQIEIIEPGEPIWVEIDRPRIERVIRNLVFNAIEHGEGMPITIEVASNAQAAAVVVADEGVGMTPEQAEHVFDRFWRADPARARTLGGTGLGLAISLEDARLHGGNLDASGVPDQGSRFRLTLPKRIGIVVEESPLMRHHPSETPRPHVVNNPHGPAALPTFSEDQ